MDAQSLARLRRDILERSGNLPPGPTSWHVYTPIGHYTGGPCTGNLCQPPHPSEATPAEKPLGG